MLSWEKKMLSRDLIGASWFLLQEATAMAGG